MPLIKLFTDEACTGYSHAGHPERPGRIIHTKAALREQKDLEIEWCEPGGVSEESLLRAHTDEHLRRLEETEDLDADTPYHEGLPRLARASAAAALSAMRSAREGTLGFSLMRPPGHHATKNRAMGFCYLSNIAIAALEALATGSKRVAIYDFDVHHGNGTEAILAGQEDATFYSVHQFPCYPGTGTRNVGRNCFNYPVLPQTARAEYRQVLESALEQLGKAKPDLVGISAGFDAYARDPLAQETLEKEDFYWLGQCFNKLGIPAFAVLEGGYSDDLPQLVLAFLKGLAGK